jgi:subtilase family serine protease
MTFAAFGCMDWGLGGPPVAAGRENTMQRRRYLIATAVAALTVATLAAAMPVASASNQKVVLKLARNTIQAPESPEHAASGSDACTAPSPDPSGSVKTYAYYHCYTAQDIRAAYGVDAVDNMGAGQTIVLMDSYGSPTAAEDLQHFHDIFFPNLPDPNFDAVYPNGYQPFKNIGNGWSGSAGAASWSGEATLDIEWSYAIAPLAHIVLVGVPPAETYGVQGLPNLFKALQWVIGTYPSGTVISQSFGLAEQTFNGAAPVKLSQFDTIYQAAAEKGDTVLASSGDNGTTGVKKAKKGALTYNVPTAGWPASSPWVTAVGGTQLQYGWTWNPTSDVPFLPDGSNNPAYFAFTNGGNTEAVWNETWLPAATGGNASTNYSMPSFQSGVGSVIGSDHRGMPDLSWNAAVNGGVLVWITAFPTYQRAGWHVYGGTSASSPQVAGLVALANEQQANDGDAPLGYLNPLLYQVGSGAAFRDIVPVTEGTAASGVMADNQLWEYEADGSVAPGPVAGNPTLTGWDLTTGFGSPKAAAFIAAVRAAANA